MATGTTNRSVVASNIPVVISNSWVLYRMPNLVFNNVIDFEYTDGIKTGDTIQLTTHLTRVPLTQINTGTTTGAAVLAPSGGIVTTKGSATYLSFGGNGAEGNYSVSFQQPTMNVVILFINQFWQGAVQLGRYATALTQDDVKGIFKQSILDNLNVKIDATKAALVASLTTTVTGTLNTNLSDEDFLAGLDGINAVDAPGDERHIVISTQELTNLFRIDKYIDKDYIDGSPVTNAEVGQLYNFRVHPTTNVTSDSSGHDSVMLHKSAIGSQLRVSATSMALANPNTVSDETTVYAVWGDAIVRDNHAAWLKGK